MNYNDAWSFLDQLQFFKIKLGLDSMNTFLDSLDNPQNTSPCIHIGGTNGKGSVGVSILTILQEAGYKVGFYTSPHLSSVRERFRINNRFISEEEFTAQSQKIINILDGRQITYFEFTTTLAMLWFAEKKVDLVILEVGMGGRLDATNVITPLVSIITNVGIDHEQYLGDTIEEIAYEKAGIIKKNIPVVAGVSKEDAVTVITARAAEKSSPLYLLNRDFTGKRFASERDTWTYSGLRNISGHAIKELSQLPLNMKGAYQIGNAAIALAALEVISGSFPVSETHIRQGLAKVEWPGRLEEFWLEQEKEKPIHFLLDGAHNPDGARALKKSLQQDFTWSRMTLIWASMSDKDCRNTLMDIAPLADTIIFTRPDEERSARPEDLAALLPDNLQEKSSCFDSVTEAIDLAVQKFQPGDMICVAGSLYLVGRARQLLRGELVDAP